jgi:3-methyladenine DNA glycosylase AlkD
MKVNQINPAEAGGMDELLRQLQALGTAQNRRIYKRHGAGDNVFGVSFADLEKLRKATSKNHPLAASLWATGNYDARNLATMIAEPATMKEKEIDHWARSVDNETSAGLLARHVISKTPWARSKAEQWIQSPDEWIGSLGWSTLGIIAMEDRELPDSYFAAHLATIEQGIHEAKNYTRHSMNGALIAIGLRSPALQKKALAAAGRIGRVEVDHGETACKTPDASAYIRKAAVRKAK